MLHCCSLRLAQPQTRALSELFYFLAPANAAHHARASSHVACMALLGRVRVLSGCSSPARSRDPLLCDCSHSDTGKQEPENNDEAASTS